MEYAIVQLFVFLVFCGTDAGFAIYRQVHDMHDQVGYVAHLCGAVAGLLVGIGVLRNLKVRPWERKLWCVLNLISKLPIINALRRILHYILCIHLSLFLRWCAVTLYFLLMISGVSIHLFYKDHFPYRQSSKGHFE